MGFSKPIITLKDTTVEWPNPVDCPLTREVDYLWLEVRSDSRVVDRVPVFSTELRPGVWSAEGRLVRPRTSAAFVIFLYIELVENKRRFLGFVKLNGPDYYDGLGKVYEIPFVTYGNMNLILKTTILGFNSVQHFFSSIGYHKPSSDAGIPVEMIREEAAVAYRDFVEHGNLQSLEKAIEHLQRATKIVSTYDSDLLAAFTDLGICLRRRFEQLRNIVDLNDSITRLEVVVSLTQEDHPDKPRRFHALGSSLDDRFELHRKLVDIDKAVKCQQKAVDLTPDNDPEKSNRLNSLATALMNRFKRFQNLMDLDDAIAANRAAVNLTPDGHRDKSMYLSNLAICLDDRFGWLRSPNDMDESIRLSQTVVSLTSDSDPDKPKYLHTLGCSLETRFKITEDLVDLENAIKSKQAAVDLTQDDRPQKPMYLHNLGLALGLRFRRLRNLDDIDKSIASYQAAIDLTPENHPDKPAYFNGLGSSFSARSERSKNLDDIDKSIKANQMAVDLTPDDHPSKALNLIGLADAYLSRVRRFNRPEDIELVITHLSAAAASQVGPPFYRFQAVKTWILAASLENHPSLLDAYESAINIMPLVAWLGLPIADRHQRLMEMGGITRDAAAAAISLKQYDKALEWLEQGRSVVWNQILQLRTPVDELRGVRPDLAERLFQVSRLLDQGSGQADPSGIGKETVEEKERHHRALTAERESIIEQVRSLPNFESFLKPLNSVRLMKSVKNGVAIILNIAKERCDALALVPGREAVSHIPLPNITSKRITELGNELKDLLYSNGMRMRGQRAAVHVEEETDEESCMLILAELWTGLVKPILDSLSFSPHPQTLPRIWWCTTGPLAFLPVHAAGIYNSRSLNDQLSNYAISSYIPTVSTLLGSHTSAVHSTFRMLSVIQPSAPGVSSIPNTKEELGCLRRHLVDRPHVVLESEAGTKRRVMKGMEECNWLHLACHGVQRPEDPTKSALILEDGHLTLEEIIRLDLPSAEFAFLSACQTTTGDEKLSEEAVHIAGGMLLAGYRGVVATMWSIQDDLAPAVADEFYARILSTGKEPDNRNAAEALHYSVQKLRQRIDVPLTGWIPFVHLGV